MFITKSQVYKLMLITLIVCDLAIISVFAGKLTRSNRDIIASVKPEVLSTAATAAIKVTENESTNKEENDKQVYNDDTTEEVNETVEKNAVQSSAADTSLSVWGIVTDFWNWIRQDISESLFNKDGKTSEVTEGRTFGKIRRLQMALIPIVFKFGVLSAMITFLVGLGIKTLFLVKLLVVMNLLALLAKFFTLKSNFGHFEHVASPPAWKWNPYMPASWHNIPEEHHSSNKEIHLHIHGNQLQPHLTSYSYGKESVGKSQGWERRNDPYSAYETIELQGLQNEVMPNNLVAASTANSLTDDGQHLTKSFPGNHRMF